MKDFCVRHMGRRNEELHTGGAPFDEPKANWHGEYYSACQILLKTLGRDLKFLLGSAEAKIANRIVTAFRDKAAKKVEQSIAHSATAWSKNAPADREVLQEQAALWATRHIGHRVCCPACQSAAIVIGTPAGPPLRTLAGEGFVMEKQQMLPAQFECVACGLKITGLSRLMAAELGDSFTATVTYDAADLYGHEPEYEPDYNE